MGGVAVWDGIVYLKTGRRMPVQMGSVIYPRDVQQDIPQGWCPVCRRELYAADEKLCRRCKGVTNDEGEGNQPLFDLHPGEKPRGL